MGLRTKRADAIKDYYFNLEELVQLYCDYDKRFEVYKREAEINRRGDKIDEPFLAGCGEKSQPAYAGWDFAIYRVW